MFKPNPDSMRMEPTPERVYSVCKLVAIRSMSRDDIRKYMTLGDRAGEAEVNASIAVATEDLGILKAIDDQLVLDVPLEAIATPTHFRRHVSSTVFGKDDSTFVLFSKWYIAQNEKVFSYSGWEARAAAARTEVDKLADLRENDVLGWRFWAAFLGLGYLHENALIPNTKTRLHDAMRETLVNRFKVNKAITVDKLLSWLRTTFPELGESNPLPMAVSAGLRTLHEMGLIRLELVRDALTVELYPVDDEFSHISHITLREDIRK